MCGTAQISAGEITVGPLAARNVNRTYTQANCGNGASMLLFLFRRWSGRGVRSIVMSMSVCLSVCPLAYLENHTAKLHQTS